jgi:hypothetical protein
VGVVLCILVYGKDFFRNGSTCDKIKDPVFNAQVFADAAPVTPVPAAVPAPEPVNS